MQSVHPPWLGSTQDLAPNTTKENMPRGQLSSGENNRPTRTNGIGPVQKSDTKTACQYCGREFLHVNKHLWRCPKRPAERDPELLVTDVDSSNKMSEQEPSLVNNHSATKEPVRSGVCFRFKDKEPPAMIVEGKKKLKLPPAKERAVWRNIDEDLVMACLDVEAEDDAKRLDHVEARIYSYLEARYGEEEKKTFTKKKQEDTETRSIRVSKRLAKNSMKSARRNKDLSALYFVFNLTCSTVHLS